MRLTAAKLQRRKLCAIFGTTCKSITH